MDEKKTKILIVDDEYAFCKSLKIFLEKAGYEVAFTTSGEQALDMIKDEKPDLMTLDMRMPGMNGYEVLEKARWANKKLKIVVISAIDIPDMEEKLMHAGAKAVLNKPVDLDKLAKTIQDLVSEG